MVKSIFFLMYAIFVFVKTNVIKKYPEKSDEEKSLFFFSFTLLIYQLSLRLRCFIDMLLHLQQLIPFIHILSNVS